MVQLISSVVFSVQKMDTKVAAWTECTMGLGHFSCHMQMFFSCYCWFLLLLVSSDVFSPSGVVLFDKL